MAIRALPALLLILFLPHLLEAYEADYLSSPEADYIGPIEPVDYSGIEVSESLAIQLAAAEYKRQIGSPTFSYSRATARKLTRVEWPEGYYDLEPGDDGGYASFNVTYWHVVFYDIQEDLKGIGGGGVTVNVRTAETRIRGPQIDHFKSNELRDGQGQVIDRLGERGFPIVKKWNETCAMVCDFNIARYEAAQRAFDKAKAAIEGVMGRDCCNTYDNINHMIVDALLTGGLIGEYRGYSGNHSSWVLIDKSVPVEHVEEIAAHELGHYYAHRMNPTIFGADFVEPDVLFRRKYDDYKKIKEELSDVLAAIIVNNGASTIDWQIGEHDLTSGTTLGTVFHRLITQQGMTFARASEIILKAVPRIKDDDNDGTISYQEVMEGMRRVANNGEATRIREVFVSLGLVRPQISYVPVFSYETYAPSYSWLNLGNCTYNFFGELGGAFMTCTPEPFFGF